MKKETEKSKKIKNEKLQRKVKKKIEKFFLLYIFPHNAKKKTHENTTNLNLSSPFILSAFL